MNCNQKCNTCDTCAKDRAKAELKSACESICETIRKRYGLNVEYKQLKKFHIKFYLAGKSVSAYTTHVSDVLGDKHTVLCGILKLEKEPDTNKPTCQVCRYGYKCPTTHIMCRRYPQHINRASTDWCGEFRRKDTGTVTDPSRWHKTDLYDVQQRCKTDLYYYGND